MTTKYITVTTHTHKTHSSGDFNLDSNIHGCQFSNQVSEYIGDRDDVHSPPLPTHATLPLREGVAQTRTGGRGFLQQRGHYAPTLLADTTLKQNRNKQITSFKTVHSTVNLTSQLGHTKKFRHEVTASQCKTFMMQPQFSRFQKMLLITNYYSEFS